MRATDSIMALIMTLIMSVTSILSQVIPMRSPCDPHVIPMWSLWTIGRMFAMSPEIVYSNARARGWCVRRGLVSDMIRAMLTLIRLDLCGDRAGHATIHPPSRESLIPCIHIKWGGQPTRTADADSRRGQPTRTADVDSRRRERRGHDCALTSPSFLTLFPRSPAAGTGSAGCGDGGGVRRRELAGRGRMLGGTDARRDARWRRVYLQRGGAHRARDGLRGREPGRRRGMRRRTCVGGCLDDPNPLDPGGWDREEYPGWSQSNPLDPGGWDREEYPG